LKPFRLPAARHSKAETATTAAETRLSYDRSNFDRSRQLFESGLIPRIQLEQIEEEVRLREKKFEATQAEVGIVLADEPSELAGEWAVATAAVEEAEGKLEVLIARTRPEEIEAMEADVARLETRREYVHEQMRLATINNPVSGIIATPRLKEKIGQQVSKGDLIAEVYGLMSVSWPCSAASFSAALGGFGQHFSNLTRSR
jgi:multidrug resistance efflux pump